MATNAKKATNKSRHQLELLKDDNATVKVIVGHYIGNQKAHSWYFQRKLLCHRSTFFQAALDFNGKSGKEEESVSLPDDLPEAFELFVQWLYTNTFDFKPSRALHLEHIWVLGDKLGSPGFKDQAMLQCFVTYLDAPKPPLPHPGMVNYVYKNTGLGAKLRRFFADLVSDRLNEITIKDPAWRDIFGGGLGDFVVDVMERFTTTDRTKITTKAASVSDSSDETDSNFSDDSDQMETDSEGSADTTEVSNPRLKYLEEPKIAGLQIMLGSKGSV
ncbi:MAG: hypothetical protein M1817_002116 [Caeruleum heppii]|nr:MAG: hypothetical protein M1817_002116 [Caeruleum heppii]